MRIITIGDNLLETSNLCSGKIKKNISKYRLLKLLLSSMLSVKRCMFHVKRQKYQYFRLTSHKS